MCRNVENLCASVIMPNVINSIVTLQIVMAPLSGIDKVTTFCITSYRSFSLSLGYLLR